MDSALRRFVEQQAQRHFVNRPIRLRLAETATLPADVLLPQRVVGTEAICAGFEYRAICISVHHCLPLRDFIGQAAALEFTTDTGGTRLVCGIITEAIAGASDGAVSTYQLVIRDAFAFLEKRINSRVFRGMSGCEIIKVILDEWRNNNAALARSFHYEFIGTLATESDPRREFAMQYNESDAAFIRRLLGRAGYGWHFRPGPKSAASQTSASDQPPMHTLAMYSSSRALPASSAWEVRYHRDSATEKRDTITAWSASTRLQTGETNRYSWDYKAWASGEDFLSAKVSAGSPATEGSGSGAATLDDYQILSPHFADSPEDLLTFGKLQMKRHDYEASCFHGEGSVRAFCTGEYFRLAGHPQLEGQADNVREFVITSLRLTGQNNFPKDLAAQVARLFARNLWSAHDTSARIADDKLTREVDSGETRFHMQFTAIHRSVDIVPRFDPRSDLPCPRLQSAVVVGPPEEQVHCDQLGRVKIRFPGMRVIDHKHAQGAGASGTVSDSAWVRVASNWAGSQASSCGALSLPRVGTEVLVDFVGGDPDKPIIVGQLYNSPSSPPKFSDTGNVPGNRYLSGIRSREIRGQRSNQLRFDDTPKQISAQLASDHGASQLNLGWLTHPRNRGVGAPRGEGAELRSDHAVAVRGAQGVLITAAPDTAATASMLDRTDLMGLVRRLLEISQQLTKVANAHCHDDFGAQDLVRLTERLTLLHCGSNIDSGPGGQGGQPIVAVNAPAGIVIGSQQSVVMGAKESVHIVSEGTATTTARAKLALRAGDGITAFADDGALKLIAANDEVRCESQASSLELIAKKVLEIISADDWVNIRAKKGIRLNVNGSELVLTEEGIRGYTGGTCEFHAAEHKTCGAQRRPLDLGVTAIPAVATLLDENQWVEIHLHDQGGNPLAGQRFVLTDPAGAQHTGVLDEHGCARVEPVKPGLCTVQFPDLDVSTSVQS